MSTTQALANAVSTLDQATQIYQQQNTNVNNAVDSMRQQVEELVADPDKKFARNSFYRQTIYVGGNINNWYPVEIHNTASEPVSIQRQTHMDSERLGLWNGSLLIKLYLNNDGHGGRIFRGTVDEYRVSLKSSTRVLPESDLPYYGGATSRLSGQTAGPNCYLYLRGETTYEIFTANSISVDLDNPRPISAGSLAGTPPPNYTRGL